jgi:hypothetical protein
LVSVFTLLLFIPEDGIRDAFCTLSICLADEVGVHILGGGNLGVAKAFGDTDRVSAGVVEDGCHGMTEFMSVDMRQIMAPLKLSEEAAQRIR